MYLAPASTSSTSTCHHTTHAEAESARSGDLVAVGECRMVRLATSPSCARQQQRRGNGRGLPDWGETEGETEPCNGEQPENVSAACALLQRNVLGTPGRHAWYLQRYTRWPPSHPRYCQRDYAIPSHMRANQGSPDGICSTYHAALTKLYLYMCTVLVWVGFVRCVWRLTSPARGLVLMAS